MSQEWREQVRRRQYCWDLLTEEEKNNLMDMCSTSDEVFRQMYPDVIDIDGAIKMMSDEEFQAYTEAVLRRYRAKKKKQKQGELDEQEEDSNEEQCFTEEQVEEEAIPA